MKLMQQTSQEVINMHKSHKELMTEELSEIVFKNCGEIILSDSWNCPQPVIWVGHDIITQNIMAN